MTETRLERGTSSDEAFNRIRARVRVRVRVRLERGRSSDDAFALNWG
jgi:hypothetical protein